MCRLQLSEAEEQSSALLEQQEGAEELVRALRQELHSLRQDTNSVAANARQTISEKEALQASCTSPGLPSQQGFLDCHVAKTYGYDIDFVMIALRPHLWSPYIISVESLVTHVPAVQADAFCLRVPAPNTRPSSGIFVIFSASSMTMTLCCWNFTKSASTSAHFIIMHQNCPKHCHALA